MISFERLQKGKSDISIPITLFVCQVREEKEPGFSHCILLSLLDGCWRS